MRLSSDINPAAALANPPLLGEESGAEAERYADYKIIRRNGAVVGFEPDKIAVAMTKAFLAVHGNSAAASAGVRDKVHALTQAVVQSLVRRQPAGGTFHIEDIQDQVELAMMRAGEHQVARRTFCIAKSARASAPSARRKPPRRRSRRSTSPSAGRASRSTSPSSRPSSIPPASTCTKAPKSSRRRSSRRRFATSTTACRSRRSTSAPSSPRGC